ncbi:MAG: hypothetical protein LBH60_02520 [Prevotellaceae bacterium]|jgi:hypothetical protein|nr:hypothetical protein [Prevotellaceae bacterium]
MNTIKYAVWGTKRGESTFFHSPELESEAINSTLDDIRGAVTITEPDCNYYSLEFTSHYKVYSQYYPVNDVAGRPGFLAVSLYIPHVVKIAPDNSGAPNDVLQLLNNMINLYRRNYVNTASRIISSVREDPSLFDGEIAKVRTVTDEDCLEKASVKNNSIKIIRYANNDDLKKYFDLPYQNEYFNHQKILFITAGLNQKFKEESILNFPPPQLSVYSITVITAGCSEILFSVNGETKDRAENLHLSDKINIHARKSGCQDFQYPDDKTVAEILRENGLSKKDCSIGLDITFRPAQKIIDFKVEDENGKPLKAVLEDRSGKLEIIDSMVAIEGEQMQETHQIHVEADGYMPVEYIVYPYEKEQISITLKKTVTKTVSATKTVPETGTPFSSDITIYVVDDSRNFVSNIEIFEGNVLLGKQGCPIDSNKIKRNTTVNLTLKRKGYEDIHKQIEIKGESLIIQINKDEWKDIQPSQTQSTSSQTQSTPLQAQLPPPQPLDNKTGFVDYITRNIIWIVSIILILALVVFVYKMKIFEPKYGKRVTILLLYGTDTVKINTEKNDTVKIQDELSLIKKGVRFSRNKDTVTFPKGKDISTIRVSISLSNKKWKLKQYQDTTINISASDTIRIIYLKETDTLTKIKNLIAKLDSTSISYGDIKQIKLLDLKLNDSTLNTIEDIFKKFEQFSPKLQRSNNNKEQNEYKSKYDKEFTDFYDKVNSLKDKLPFNAELLSFKDKKNYLINRLQELKKLEDKVTLELIFTKNK